MSQEELSKQAQIDALPSETAVERYAREAREKAAQRIPGGLAAGHAGSAEAWVLAQREAADARRQAERDERDRRIIRAREKGTTGNL